MTDITRMQKMIDRLFPHGIPSALLDFSGQDEKELVGTLISLLGDEDDDTRVAAVQLLEEINAPDALIPLYRLWENPGPHHAYLEEALQAIVQIGSAHLPFFAECLTHANPGIRADAAYILGAVPGEEAAGILLSRIHDASFTVNKAVAFALSQHTNRALVQQLRRGMHVETTREKMDAALVLAYMHDKQCCPVLFEAMRAEDWHERMRAAEGLGWLRDTRCLDALLTLLEDPSSIVRETAVASIGWRSVEKPDVRKAMPFLLSHVMSDASLSVRKATISALGLIRDHRAIAPLTRLLSDRDMEIRVESIKALALFGPAPAVIEALLPLLEDADPAVRLAAVHQLGDIGDSHARAEVVTLASTDPDAEVRKMAGWFIEEPDNSTI